jgi:sec-independent protein translocase protein TatA
MGSLSIWHWILVLGVGVLLFGGRGKISSVMGDFAKGIKAFKAGLADEETTQPTPPPAQVAPPTAAATVAPTAKVADQPHEHA